MKLTGKARVKIFGPPEPEPKLIAEFVTTGMQDPPSWATCYLFVFMVDYSGMGNEYPRSKYAYPLIAHKWDWQTRQGVYFSAPYKGRIEIEAE